MWTHRPADCWPSDELQKELDMSQMKAHWVIYICSYLLPYADISNQQSSIAGTSSEAWVENHFACMVITSNFDERPLGSWL